MYVHLRHEFDTCVHLCCKCVNIYKRGTSAFMFLDFVDKAISPN